MKKIKSDMIKKTMTIEESFFDIDKENKVAFLNLSFQSPKEIFDENFITKEPLLSSSFLEGIMNSYDIIPSKYRIDLCVEFDTLDGYTEEDLTKIFLDNMGLEFRSVLTKERRKRKIAYWLLAIGLLLFTAMMFITHLWKEESVLKQIFEYVADIATTVAFWEALTILVVENHELQANLISIASRFNNIRFVEKDKN